MATRRDWPNLGELIAGYAGIVGTGIGVAFMLGVEWIKGFLVGLLLGVVPGVVLAYAVNPDVGGMAVGVVAWVTGVVYVIQGFRDGDIDLPTSSGGSEDHAPT